VAVSAAAASEAAVGEAGEAEKWRRRQQRQPTMMVLLNNYIVECVRFLLSCGYFCHFFSPAISPRQKFDKGLPMDGYGKQNLHAEKC
jgi:hypothetical protein